MRWQAGGCSRHLGQRGGRGHRGAPRAADGGAADRAGAEPRLRFQVSGNGQRLEQRPLARRRRWPRRHLGPPWSQVIRRRSLTTPGLLTAAIVRACAAAACEGRSRSSVEPNAASGRRDPTLSTSSATPLLRHGSHRTGARIAQARAIRERACCAGDPDRSTGRRRPLPRFGSRAVADPPCPDPELPAHLGHPQTALDPEIDARHHLHATNTKLC